MLTTLIMSPNKTCQKTSAFAIFLWLVSVRDSKHCTVRSLVKVPYESLYHLAAGEARKILAYILTCSRLKRESQKRPWFLHPQHPTAGKWSRLILSSEKESTSPSLLQPPRKTVWRCLKSHTPSKPSKQGRLYFGQNDKTRRKEAKSEQEWIPHWRE